MFHENEIVMLFLSLGVLIFVFVNRKSLAKFKGWKLLFACFILLIISCISTVVEGFIFENFFNYLEHFCYAGSGIILVTWCYRLFKEDSEQ